MRIVLFGCAIACMGLLSAEFDLKQYERSLKKVIPWSLEGSAQDLRSDAKHALQMILRSIVLLRPDVPWKADQKPDADFIPNGFKKLQEYLALPGNGPKKQWVVDSLAFITDTYIPEVERLLEQPGTLAPDLNALLAKKRELMATLSQAIREGQGRLLADEHGATAKKG